ncbi:MAG: PrcB C-terminal domain protein [Gemmatimonadetes bacterium]|nr:PrcB C-terminal domain protein [Gemmatimonadota bacterium]
MKTFLHVVPVVAAAACGTAYAAAQPADRIPVPVIRLAQDAAAFSAYSGFGDSLRTVVRDSTLWRQVWERLNQPFVPRPKLPNVDFEREMVVVAALGIRHTAGYSVVIEGADRDSSSIEVAVRRTSPAAGCPVEAVVTQPVDVARIPRSERAIRFRERSVVTSCASP